MSTCLYCEATIDTALGAVAPTGEEHDGTPSDPRAPGAYDDVCDRCNYGLGLRGGPNADPSLFGRIAR